MALRWLANAGDAIFPIIRWLPKYRAADLPGDVIAAAALAALAAPEAVSYAGIAGLPPVQGLFTALVAPLTYAAVGGSPLSVVGPTTIMSLLTRASLPSTWAGVKLIPETVLYVKLASLLALTVGILQVALSCLRAAFLTRLISEPAVLGFTVGSALLIASTQFSTLLGAPKCVAPAGGSCTVIQAVQNIISAGQAGKLDWSINKAPIGSLICVVFLFAYKYGVPAFLKRVRLTGKWLVLGNAGPLVLLIVACGIMAVPAWRASLAAANIKAGEAIPAGLPAPSSPFPADEDTGGPLPSAGDITGLLAAAVPVAAISFLESLTIAKTVARQYGPYSFDDQTELFAVGVSNVMVAVNQGYAVSGSFSRTAVNAASGARTPLASAMAGAVLIVVLLALTGPLSNLPKVASASIVLLAIARLLEFGELVRLWRSDKRDWLVAAAVFCVIVTWDVGPGLVVGVALQWLVGLTRGFSLRSEVAVWRLHATCPAAGLHATAVDAATGGVNSSSISWATAAVAAALSPTDVAAKSSASFAGPLAAAVAAPGSEAAASVDAAAVSSCVWLKDEPASEGPVGAADLLAEGDAAKAVAIAGSNTPAAAAPAVVLLRFEPGLQFSEAARLSSHLEEASQCYSPLLTVLDAGRIGAMDSTGAATLLTEGDDAVTRRLALQVQPALAAALQNRNALASAAAESGAPARAPIRLRLRCGLLVGGLNRHALTRLLRTAAARGYGVSAIEPADASAGAAGDAATGTTGDDVEEGGPSGGSGSDADAEASLIARAAAAAGGVGVLRVGELLLVETGKAALALAQALASERLRQGLTQAKSASTSTSRAEDRGVAGNADGSRTAGATSGAAGAGSSTSWLGRFTCSRWCRGASAANDTRAVPLEEESAAEADAADAARDDAEQERAGLPRRVVGIQASTWAQQAMRRRRALEPLVAGSVAPPSAAALAGGVPPAPGPLPFVRFFRALHSTVQTLRIGAQGAVGVSSGRSSAHPIQASASASGLPVHLDAHVLAAVAPHAVPEHGRTHSVAGVELGSAAAPTASKPSRVDETSASAPLLWNEHSSGAAAVPAPPRLSVQRAASSPQGPGSLLRTASATIAATLTPAPGAWLEPAVAVPPSPRLARAALSPAAASPAASAASPRPLILRSSSSGPSKSSKCVSVALAPAHAAVGAVRGIKRVASVFAETQPFLQLG